MPLATFARRGRPAGRITASADAYVQAMLHDTKMFVDWCSNYGVKGFVGEFGWRGGDLDDPLAWQRFAEAFYGSLVGGPDIWTCAWLASEFYPQHRLAVYRGSNQGTLGSPVTDLNTVTPGGKIVEQHKGVGRGVNLGNHGENGFGQTGATCPASNAREAAGYAFGDLPNLGAPDSPDTYFGGNYARGWNYGTANTWAFLAARGVQLVRLPFRWERVQRTFNAALDTTEVARINTALSRAAANGIQVVLDCHNFGYYYLDNGTQGVATAVGGASIPDSYFADLWTRLIGAFDSNSAVVGYDLMNEPVGCSTWLASTGQAAVTAIRNAGSTKCIIVEGHDYAIPSDFSIGSPTPWITDPGNNLRYSSHAYFNRANSGGASSAYGYSYYEELAFAKTQPHISVGLDIAPTPAPGPTIVDTFTRPDAQSLGSTEDSPVRAAWQNNSASNNFGIASGQAGILNNPGQAREWINVPSADCTIECDFPTVGGVAAIWLRGASDGSGLIAQFNNLYYRDSAGNFSTLGSLATALVDGDRMQVIASGTTITIKSKHPAAAASWVTQLTVTGVTQNQACTQVGFFAYSGTTARWDNFTVYAPTAPVNAPAAPTIGTALAGTGQATVTFTPALTGGQATSFTVTSSAGPSVTVTNKGVSNNAPMSVVIPGLTVDVAQTFTVTASNAAGSSAASAASNSVTPAQTGNTAGATTILSDNFSADADGALTGKAPTTGPAWTGPASGVSTNVVGHVVKLTNATLGHQHNYALITATSYRAAMTFTRSTVAGRGNIGFAVLAANNDVSTGFSIGVQPDNTISVFRNFEGTVAVASAAQSLALGSTHTLSCRVTPTTLTVYLDGTQLLTYNLTTTEQQSVTRSGPAQVGNQIGIGGYTGSTTNEDGTSTITQITVTN